MDLAWPLWPTPHSDIPHTAGRKHKPSFLYTRSPFHLHFCSYLQSTTAHVWSASPSHYASSVTSSCLVMQSLGFICCGIQKSGYEVSATDPENDGILIMLLRKISGRKGKAEKWTHLILLSGSSTWIPINLTAEQKSWALRLVRKLKQPLSGLLLCFISTKSCLATLTDDCYFTNLLRITVFPRKQQENMTSRFCVTQESVQRHRLASSAGQRGKKEPFLLWCIWLQGEIMPSDFNRALRIPSNANRVFKQH